MIALYESFTVVDIYTGVILRSIGMENNQTHVTVTLLDMHTSGLKLGLSVIRHLFFDFEERTST